MAQAVVVLAGSVDRGLGAAWSPAQEGDRDAPGCVAVEGTRVSYERLAVGESHTFVILGKPAPGGSKTMRPVFRDGVPVMKDGKPVIAIRPSSKRTKPWMVLCEATYRSDWGTDFPIDAPFQVEIVFYFDKPKNVKSWDLWPLKSGNDNDKLERATLDPLGGNPKNGWGGVIENDRRIVKLSSERRFGLPERAEVTITRLPLLRVEDPVEQLGLIDALSV